MISGNIFTNSIEKLVEAGILKDDARFDIELLKDVYLDKGEEAFIEAVNRRCQGEPVAYILGRQSFYMENYYVEPGVLIPRSDTEILVEAALKAMGLVKFPMGDISKINFAIEKDTYHIADLCTGTGCVGISVANQVVGAGKQLEMLLADISDIALNCAEKNVKSQAKTNIKIKKFDVLNGDYETLSDHKLDMILSNPPYITDEEIYVMTLNMNEFKFELCINFFVSKIFILDKFLFISK